MPICTRCQQPATRDAERCPNCGAWLSPLTRDQEAIQQSLQKPLRLLLGQGQKIAAIKLYRERTGVGLAEAKAAIERIGQGDVSGSAEDSHFAAADALETSLLGLLLAGQKIAAIKLYREQTRSGLKDAKDAVEALAAQHGIVPPETSSNIGVLGIILLGLSVLLLGFLIWAAG